MYYNYIQGIFYSEYPQLACYFTDAEYDCLLNFPLFPSIAWSAVGRWCCNTHVLEAPFPSSSSKVRQWNVEFWWLGQEWCGASNKELQGHLKIFLRAKRIFQGKSCSLEESSCLGWDCGGKVFFWFFSVYVVSREHYIQHEWTSWIYQSAHKMPSPNIPFPAGSQVTTPPSTPSAPCYTAISWGKHSCFGQMILPLYYASDFNSHLSNL